jgi:DNA-binding transcriptional LysR family regulator
LDLDGRLLRLFLSVYREGSVTKAAAQLGVSQSAVSHALDRLRAIVGDPLFVRAGRGIVPTSRAEALVEEACELLAAMQTFTDKPTFDPSSAAGEFTFAVNDHQRELLLVPVVKKMLAAAPGLDVKIIDSGFPDAELLRNERCDLTITPDPPDGTEFVQQRLLADRWVCFFDASVKPGPDSLKSYADRRHAKVVFAGNDRGVVEEILEARGIRRRVALRVPNFGALPGLMKGTDIIAVLPSRLRDTLMRGFDLCPCPIPLPELPYFMVWHLRHQRTPLHMWVRDIVKTVAAGLAD